MPRRRFFLRVVPTWQAFLLRVAAQVSTGLAVVLSVTLSAILATAVSSVLPGQESSGAEPSATATVREAAPEIYYMQDDTGRLVPVPGFRYRDFVDLLRIKEGMPGLPEPPPAVLENVVLRATLPAPASKAAEAAAGTASQPAISEVSVELTVRQSRTGWVSLPLALDGLLLTAAPIYKGPGRMLLAADATGRTGVQQGGYRLWMTGTANGSGDDVRHAVTLTGNIAIEASPTHESLSLAMPRATASLVELKTSRIDPDVSVRPASQPPRIEPRPGDEGSIVTLVGLAGAAQIRIGDRRSVAGAEKIGIESARAAVPQAMVESLVRIDGRVAVTEATILLDDLPAGLETIRVALPPRATLRSIGSPSSLVELAGSEAQPEAVIQIERGIEGKSLVEITCERPVDPAGREAFEALGFAVENIPSWRQWGRASIVVEGDWQVEWDGLGSNRRIDPPASARRPGFVAAFAYDAQPARLPLRVLPRGSRVVIEPEYRYDVSATRVTLDARLRVSVRGAPVSRIVVALDAWDIDEVGPASVVDSAAVSMQDGRLVIPFVQPLSGDAVVEVRCGRSLIHDSSRVAWRIPAPQADLVGPASIIIASQSDIELLPDADGVRGLVRQLTSNATRSDADRVALAYRLDGTDGTFEATRRFLARRVDVSVTAQADIDESDIIVRETIRFDVAHVPLEFVTLSVPESVMQTATLEVRQNGLLLNPDQMVQDGDAVDQGEPAADGVGAVAPLSESASGLAAPRVRLRAMLAQPLLGAGDITVEYELPTPRIAPESTVAEDLPLVLPAATRIGRQSITLTVPETLSLDVRGDAWKRDVASLGSIPSRTWTTARAQESVPLAISARKRSALGDTVVDAAWLQTRLLDNRRDDVYRYAIVSSADQIILALPPSFTADAGDSTEALAGPRTDAQTVEVRLNGQSLPGAVRTDGTVVVELPQRAGNAAWLVEVAASRRRDLAAGLFGGWAGLPTAVSFEPPTFPAGTLQRRFYWELVLEPDEHPIGHPGGWTSQQRWEWGPFGLHRVPIVSSDAIAAWLTASSAVAQQVAAAGGAVPGVRPLSPTGLPVDLPAAGPRAVFSGVGSPGTGRIWVVPTWLLVLCVSGPVLAIGVLSVYWPRLRSVPWVLGTAVAASLAAAAFPQLAPLVAQAAIPGAALAMLAAALRKMVDRRGVSLPARGAVVLGSASSLTQVAPLPSLIIAASAPSQREEATAAGREHP
jgi:hypothetical protein